MRGFRRFVVVVIFCLVVGVEDWMSGGMDATTSLCVSSSILSF